MENRATDALSRRMMTLREMRTEVMGFENLKSDYSDCPDFGMIYSTLTSGGECLVDDYFL